MPLSLSPCLLWSWTIGSNGTVSVRFRSEIHGEIHHQMGTPRDCGTCSLSAFAMISSDCNERESWNIQLKTTFTIMASIMSLKIMTPRGKDYRNTPKCQDDVAIGILFCNILWRERWIIML